jgi:hypothetical protein
MRKMMRLSLLFLTVISTLQCAAQSEKVVVQKARLDDNPLLTNRCSSNDYLNADWIDDQTLLVRFVLQPCGKGSEVKFGYTTMDLQGKTIAYADGDAGTMEPGPNGAILARNGKKNVQLLDEHFGVIKTIDCDTEKCGAYVSADRTGFSVCRTNFKSDCRYFRGSKGDEAKVEDFPEGFPDLDINQRDISSPPGHVHYAAAGDEVWYFDDSGHLFRSVSGGTPKTLSNPASSIMREDCDAIVSKGGRRRFLSRCVGGLGYGSDEWVYYFQRYVLYDVPSHKVLLKLSVSGNIMRMSPDGSHLSFAKPAPLGGRSSLLIYYAP